MAELEQRAAHPPVLANAAAAALLAHAALPPVLSQMLPPPHSLHLVGRRPCGQGMPL